jgi:hypothetical protein
MSNPHRLMRADLMRVWPYCHWCGCEVVEPLHGVPGQRGPNLATIDHLFFRGHPEARRRRALVVLACWPCNNARASIDQALVMRGRPPNPLALPLWWEALIERVEDVEHGERT